MIVPRYYLQGVEHHVRSYQLTGFCDASTGVYAAVVYLLVRSEVQQYVRFIAAKTRVAPTQNLTIPRLELLLAVLLARLISSIFNTLSSLTKLEPSVCYTDSEVARY